MKLGVGRQATVDFGAGCGEKTVGKLFLKHDNRGTEVMLDCDETSDEGGRDLIGQVGNTQVELWPDLGFDGISNGDFKLIAVITK